MAPPSPRRSSRARGNTITQTQQTSSTSSLSSRSGDRNERNTRSLNKTTSAKSTPAASLSSEPLDDFDDGLFPRRRTRGQEEPRDQARPDPYEMANDDEIQEDDESVRCICGFDEYPGPPPFTEDAKHGKNPEADFFASIELSDEVSGLFVQCDICKVWQHGACVGIFTEESSPDEYFCEKCRKDHHKIHTASNGQRYSTYLPLGRPSRTASRATSQAKEGTRSPKEPSTKSSRAAAAAAAATQAAKRRSTMNSRDAAYDEEEQLRRAIEASKEEHPLQPADGATRRTKRGRSDSNENESKLKRQRTGSSSTTPPADKSVAVEDESEDEATTRNGSKKPRNSRNPREQREKSENEERDRQKTENGNKRKNRADRRRGDDPSEEVPLATTRAAAVKQSAEPQPPAEPTPSSAPTPDPTPVLPPPTGSTHKKSGRSHQKRGKGRNQYTKDRDDHDGSPARSMSRDTARQADEQQNGGSAPKTAASENTKHPSKGKGHVHSKISMSDMKRRVGAFLDFISKTQVEMAGESSSGSRGSQDSSQHASPEEPAGGIAQATANGQAVNGSSAATENGVTANGMPTEPPTKLEPHEFKDLNCVEMMDVLTRDLVKWQNQYAH